MMLHYEQLIWMLLEIISNDFCMVLRFVYQPVLTVQYLLRCEWKLVQELQSNNHANIIFLNISMQRHVFSDDWLCRYFHHICHIIITITFFQDAHSPSNFFCKRHLSITVKQDENMHGCEYLLTLFTEQVQTMCSLMALTEIILCPTERTTNLHSLIQGPYESIHSSQSILHIV